MTVNRENYNAVKTMLKAMPAAKVTAFLTSFGRCSEVLKADDLAGVVARMDEFAPSVPSQESACNSSSHVSVFNVALRWTR